MENAVWLAKIFGPLLAIVGFWMLTYCDNCNKVMTSMKSTPGAHYVSGVINVLSGLVIISMYNVWMWQPALLVTILGWVMLLRGICTLFFPHACMKCTASDKGGMKVLCVIPLVWGLALCWFAFLM